MPVDPKDREAFEEGKRVSDMGVIETIAYDLGDALNLGSARSESEQAAYEAGRYGGDHAFDEEKKED